MFEGKRFFPETGIPIWKRARSRVLLAVWLPDPLTVATWIVNRLSLGDKGSSRVRVVRAHEGRRGPAHPPISTPFGSRGARGENSLQLLLDARDARWVLIRSATFFRLTGPETASK